MKGKFIVIEGIDGTGKSTLARRLRNRIELHLNVPDVFTTREPGSSIENIIREMFKRPEGPPSSEFMSVMFTADRLLHMDQKVLPALKLGTWVISDRHKLSTLVYQTHMGAKEEELRILCGIPQPDPDLTIVLDADPEVTRERMLKRNETLDAYESRMDKQRAMRKMYAENAGAFGPGVVIDASGNEEQTLDLAFRAVAERFPQGVSEP